MLGINYTDSLKMYTFYGLILILDSIALVINLTLLNNPVNIKRFLIGCCPFQRVEIDKATY